jgi:hypothetical protein
MALKSPIGPSVFVKWDQATEFVPIHPKYPVPNPFYTVEYWRENGQLNLPSSPENLKTFHLNRICNIPIQQFCLSAGKKQQSRDQRK